MLFRSYDVGFDTDKNIPGTALIKVKTEDYREGLSLFERGFIAGDERDAFSVYKGKPDEPSIIKIYASLWEIPAYSLGVSRDSKTEFWRNYKWGFLKKDGHKFVLVEEIDPLRQKHNIVYSLNNFVYPELSWRMMRDGIFYVRTDGWDY